MHGGATRWVFGADAGFADLAVGGGPAFVGGVDGYVCALGG